MQGSKVYRTAPTLGWLTASIYHRPNESVTKSHTFCRSRACRLSSTEQRFSPLTDIVIVRPFSSLTDTVIDCTVFLISQRHRYWLRVISHLSPTLSLCVISHVSATLALTVQHFPSLADIVIGCATFLISLTLSLTVKHFSSLTCIGIDLASFLISQRPIMKVNSKESLASLVFRDLTPSACRLTY